MIFAVETGGPAVTWILKSFIRRGFSLIYHSNPNSRLEDGVKKSVQLTSKMISTRLICCLLLFTMCRIQEKPVNGQEVTLSTGKL